MKNFLLPLLQTVAEHTKDNFVKKTRQVEAVQERFLRDLLRAYQATELGQKYGFK
ncbi:GH3 family domain-containing protein, partial [Chroococcidiopsis sp.]|uniref:GH3 family domain-containing protein n=1 Tax=Chroococcidiopsis sp. TaxID=3088168 RepID=UPI003F38970F